jgi:hypothetical protein
LDISAHGFFPLKTAPASAKTLVAKVPGACSHTRVHPDILPI